MTFSTMPQKPGISFPIPLRSGKRWEWKSTRQEIDEKIGGHIRGWNPRRLSKVSLALLRLAVYEMLWEKGIPTSVSINEAVELAKTVRREGRRSLYQWGIGVDCQGLPEEVEEGSHE